MKFTNEVICRHAFKHKWTVNLSQHKSDLNEFIL